jgi:putative peptidoglycan lipid II flippase
MSDMEVQKSVVDAPKTVARSAIQFFLGTILSRFSGLFREVALGAWFGATPVLAAFFVAYRFSQLLRRLFGESALLSSFSPHYEQLKAEAPEKAGYFFRDLCASMSTLLGSLIILLEAGLFVWWKWGGAADSTREILFLTMVMLPGVLFVCLYALFSALLQTDRKYFLPSVAPIFFNLIFLAVLWNVKEWEPEAAIAALAAGVTLAFFAQWFSLLFSPAFSLRKLQWSAAKLWTPELKKMVSAISLTIIGIGAVQINSFVDTLFARSTDLSGPAYLYFAIRIYQLPLALFGIALSSALLPPLARARLSGDKAQFLSLLQFALRKSLTLMIPLTIALLVFGDSIVNAVYGRGAFDEVATIETTWCLWGYSAGLVPAVLVLLLAPAFYAQKDFKTPLKASLLSVALNLILNIIFIYGFSWGSASVATATSIAAFLNAGYLFYALTKQEGAIFDRKTLFVSGEITLCALLAGAVTLLVGYFLIGGTAVSLFFAAPSLSRDLLSQILHLSVYGGIFILFFLSYAWMLRVEEVFRMLGLKR